MQRADDKAVVEATVRWLERAVIGLNLCPFAKAMHVRQRIRYVVSAADEQSILLEELAHELKALAQPEAGSGQFETTLLIYTGLFNDFVDFNAFLGRAEALVQALGLEGVLQLASFHPAYQFAGEAAGDISHCTNRSPFPTLHLLLEESVSRAVEAYPDPGAIYEANIATLRRLGWSGWRALGVGAPSEAES